MSFGLKRISNNNIDTNNLKIGDLIGIKIIPSEIGFGIDKIQELECIIVDFTRFSDEFYVPTIMILLDEECLINLDDKRIKSFFKIGELNNTHILCPYSSYGYDDISVNINNIKRTK